MGTLRPSKRIKELRSQLYQIKDKRKIDNRLREIQREVITLEVQHNNLTIKNRELVHESNEALGLPDPIVPF